MALPLGPILLLTVVGAAVFGGLDVRKKKKNGVTPPPQPSNGEVEMGCIHLIEFSDDAKMGRIDGGSWQLSEAVNGQDRWAIEQQRPQVVVAVCQDDPTTLQVLEQFCEQEPDIDFYITFRSGSGGLVRDRFDDLCTDLGNPIAVFAVTTPTGPLSGRLYNGNYIPEIRIMPGSDISDVLSNVVAFTLGADHPQAEDYLSEEVQLED